MHLAGGWLAGQQAADFCTTSAGQWRRLQGLLEDENNSTLKVEDGQVHCGMGVGMPSYRPRTRSCVGSSMAVWWELLRSAWWRYRIALLDSAASWAKDVQRRRRAVTVSSVQVLVTPEEI